MSKSFLTYHYNENDAIRGERIVIEARKITDPVVFSDRTSSHRGQRSKAENGEAWIERAYTRGPRRL